MCISLKLRRVIDLTDAKVQRRLGLVLKHLKEEDWRKIQDGGAESLTQTVGRAAFDSGVEALIARSSAVRGGVNTAYFPANKMKSSQVSIYDQETLDRMLCTTAKQWKVRKKP
ncbi:MAG: RES family NAD+ phosphorylase [Akkermansiaceae bacterium]|nr:RES family NAD+ phosphorylase [Akkermansiaceae bacterium]